MMTYFSSIGGFFKMDGRDPLQSDSQWGWIGWEGEWMIGTDCEKLAKGAWRLIVFVAGYSLRRWFCRDECVYIYIPRYFILETYNAFFISSREFFLRISRELLR